MRTYQKCNKCHKWHWSDKDCDPEYKVYFEHFMGEEAMIFHTTSHENAALLFAQYYNTTNDHCLVNNEIEVKVEKDHVVKYFKVGAEPDIHYSSSEIDALSTS